MSMSETYSARSASSVGYPPPTSPPRKRQRLSSPTYDAHLGDLSQEDIAAFDIIAAQFSQPQSPATSCSQTNHNGRMDPTDDPENPFATGTKALPAAFTAASSVSSLGFSKASDLRVETAESSELSPSPEEPLARDFDSWFQPASLPPPAFQIASAAFSTVSATGFSKASHKGLIVPSSSALAKAQAKMQDIWQEPDRGPTSSFLEPSVPARTTDIENTSASTSGIIMKSPHRPALQSVGNSLNFNSPLTPSPLDASRLPVPFKINAPAMTPTQLFVSKNSKPFKSPLINKQALTRLNPIVSTLNAGHRLSVSPIVRSQSIPPFNQATASRHPITPKVGSGVGKNLPAPFVTPFKPGVVPRPVGPLQSSELRQTQESHHASTKQLAQGESTRPARTSYFDLTPPLNRQTLQSSGLVPQRLGADKLEAMEIPIELLQMTPHLAIYYTFHTPIDNSSSSPPVVLGPKQALSTLTDHGCLLATKSWVDNHWRLILWKLAGIVCLNLQKESKVDERKWCWDEVMRQLYYRYERELNRGKRPPLRLVTTQDASAAYPMILCVSDIIYTESESLEHPQQQPELEVTDGWYRIRAQVDAPLARAIRRGLVKVGRKIMIAGAYLLSEKKEPSEILEAYDSVKLVISGNSSHMAPWHAKLGFVPGPCISTLHSLTPDGGTIAVMDLVVVKIHPIAYFEFIEDDNGSKIRKGPMNAKEEAVAHDEWKKRWENEMSKLRAELNEKWDRYMGYVERLERRATTAGQDDPPGDDIESVYDELEDPAQAAQYIRERMERDKLRVTEDLENEMKHLCPPRNVHNFRVVVVQDGRTRRRPGNRKALLTVWDVLSLSFSEGVALGSFEIGQRFMVTNLKPTHQQSWMGLKPNAEVYLCTGQHSRWTPIRTPVAN